MEHEQLMLHEKRYSQGDIADEDANVPCSKIAFGIPHSNADHMLHASLKPINRMPRNLCHYFWCFGDKRIFCLVGLFEISHI